ncbi:MAG: FAD-dependent oxidoreductase [Saprospiraceae bacterium]
MDKEFLIVGHGLTGCVLALTFYKRNIPFRILGQYQPGEASLVSSGLITPVTGRKYVKSWMIDEFLESAIEFYTWTEKLFGQQFFFPVEIIRFLSHPEALLAWEKRTNDEEYAKYVSIKRLESLDRMDRPYGILTGAYRLDAFAWMNAARSFLEEKGLLDYGEATLSKEDDDEKLITIFATGAIGELQSKGIIPNKGEALVVRMPEWQYPAIVKVEVFFIPLREEHLYWVGSYYEPWPSDPGPSVEGKQQLMKAIREIYNGPLVIVDHLSGVRATVDDRRPLVGRISGNEKKYMFNGMGTKGTSLAPYWADRLTDHLYDGHILPGIVDPARY